MNGVCLCLNLCGSLTTGSCDVVCLFMPAVFFFNCSQ
jgi:hypothetical protein